MKVKLLNHTPLSLMVYAVRESHDSFEFSDSELIPLTDNLGVKDLKLIKRLFLELKHESIGEHVNYTFELIGVPRYVLQELARHRIGISMTVKSTRYTLNKELIKNFDEDYNLFEENIDEELFRLSNEYLSKVLQVVKSKGLKPDQFKKVIPENYTTNIVLTANMRSLRHLFELRIHPAALDDFQTLAREIYNSLPSKHKQFLETKYNEE